jgi:hypothetical protein
VQFQLFGKKHEESPTEFWQQTAEKRGGPIGYMTYGSLLGRSGDTLVDLPGLVYTVGDSVWFEDFERDNWFARIVTSKKKFEKTEFSFPRADVTLVRMVSRGAAIRCISGNLPADRLPQLGFFGRIFSTPVIQVSMQGGTALFFDILQRREFIGLFATS